MLNKFLSNLNKLLTVLLRLIMILSIFLRKIVRLTILTPIFMNSDPKLKSWKEDWLLLLLRDLMIMILFTED